MKVLLLTCSFILTLNFASGNNDDCHKACTMLHAPVCGINNAGEMQEFGNVCMFEAHQCLQQEQKWKLHSKTACPQSLNQGCPKMCTRELKPVCARNKDGKYQSFGNLCVFKNEQECLHPDEEWLLLGFAQCKFFETDPCPKVCTREVDYVCARSDKDGLEKTFNNPCLFKQEQCDKPEERWFLLSAHAGCQGQQ